MTSTQELHGQRASRPRSAVDATRFASQSLGKFFQAQNLAMDEQTVNTIWKGFGSYIAKQMRNGKGISVPKFGNFTFTAPNVDLAGTTNPGERDKQNRDPVFIVGKDFVSGTELRTGIAHQGGGQVRPYDVKGASGIIPKVKVNYTEVALLCSQNKDICRNACEQVYRFLSDKVRKGESVSMEIPFVGTFIVRGGISAIAFKNDLTSEVKGVTAKNHYVNKLFASSGNKLNLQIGDQNQVKANPSIGLGGAVRLTGDAEAWLKNNLNISVQEILSRPYDTRQSQRIHSAKSQGMLNRYASVKPDDLRNKSWALGASNVNGGSLTEHNKQLFDRMSDTKSSASSKRPMSAYSRATSNSRVTNVPELGRMKLMIIANDIFKHRQNITEMLPQMKLSMRDVVSSSELCQVLKKVGLYIEVLNIKALLKAFGFNWNGAACNFLDLFNATKNFIYGKTAEEEKGAAYFNSLTSPQSERPQSAYVKSATQFESKSAEQLIAQIKDLFYSTHKSIYEIYQAAKLGQYIDFEGLRKVVQTFSNGNMISDADIKTVFNHVAKGQKELTYQDFERAFKWELLAGGDWETKTVRNIREWMFKNNLSSETTFDMFLKHAGKLVQKRLNRVDFHKALSICGLSFSAPEVDGLFYLLDLNQDGELDVDEWRSRIYEDSLNPLQMLREVVANNRLTSDDLLFKMQLRIWDAPLDFPQLTNALRRLDPTLNEPQLRHLAKSLKSKDNKIEVTALLRNLCGQEHETVDFRNKIFREIYAEVHPNKEDQLQQLLEDADPLNDGRVEPQGLKVALKKVVRKIDEESIDRFIRFLDKDQAGKINYMDFLQHMSEVSNRDHNPFKSVVQRLAYFISSNKQTVAQILKRLAVKKHSADSGPSRDAIPIDLFATFLKAKIDKKRGSEALKKYAHYMDIDKDGYITEIDVQTCLSNLNSDTFFKNNGEALASSAFASAKKFYPNQAQLSEERLAEVMKQVRTALIGQKIAYREAFNRFDENKDSFLSFGEFSSGMDKILTLSVPIKEKLFAIMDKNKIGLIDYPNFLEVIQLSSATSKKATSEDNFDWENGVIDKIKDWIHSEGVTVEEGFKCFDKDFDGYISKDDLKYGLLNILEVKPEAIQPTKLDRLFRLMDFFKTGKIQLSDFQRIVNNENPYQTTGSSSTQNFRKSCGGGFTQTSTFDWKLSAIQQMGLYLSKNYSSLPHSFESISEHMQKISFDHFKKFIESSNCLQGFNMTLALIQKLFSEIDPHKKGYLSEQDWTNAFQSFKWNDQILIELKNAIQCNFTDADSAFEFFLTFKSNQQSGNKALAYTEFEKAVNSLTADRFKSTEIKSLWKSLTEGKKSSIDKYQFRAHFETLKYTGTSTVRNLKSAPPGARTTIQTQSSSSSQWESDIFEKVRQIIRTSSKSFEDIFNEFDEDGNGTISQTEFRNAIRKLNLGLSSREIDKIMERIDLNNDGKIDYREFMAKFKTSNLDERLKERAKDKMARIKELMILHMTSPNDAFRFFDESKLGKLTYQEFSKLIIKLHELSGTKPPAYPVIKDLFDTIDIRKDGILDQNEWQQTFGNVIEGNNQLSIKATPLNLWENSREFQHLGSMIAKNRKLLKEQFEKVSGGKSTIIDFEQVKKAMDEFLNLHFKGLPEEKLKCALRPSEIQGAAASNPGTSYDYVRLLNIYKDRHAGPQIIIMSDQIVLRVMSKAGRSRIEISSKEPLATLKTELETRLNVPANQLQLFLDERQTKKLDGRDTDSLAALKLKNGDQIFVANQETVFTSNVVSGAQPKKIEESKSDVEMIDTSSSPGHGSPKKKAKPLSEQEVKKGHCHHGPNAKCVNCLGVTKETMADVKPTCRHGPNEKCPNCLAKQEAISNIKHESFEHFLSEMKSKCKGQHRPDQKCQNCVPVQEYSYKVNYKCPNHKPYPEGMCNKCLPPAVVLKRQSFRHVDYVSFMNFKEMSSFVGCWQQTGCMEQRMGWLYGYYSEDPNYPEGVRVNVEAIYEPPQVGEINGVEPLNDPQETQVDMLAAALSLERVGWIFTSISHDTFLSSGEIRKVASLQQKYLVEHPEGYKVSKFVTVVVKPKGDGSEIGLECYMVSDQCQALERDDVFGVSESRKKMTLREPSPNEMIPTVLMEGKPAKVFEPDFFIVSLAHGQPKTHKDYNILKNYDFPVGNRGKNIARSDFKDYLKRHKGEPSQRSFANFQMLVYLMQMMDIDTALTIAQNVSEERALDPALVELLESV